MTTGMSRISRILERRIFFNSTPIKEIRFMTGTSVVFEDVYKRQVEEEDEPGLIRMYVHEREE